MIAMRTGVTVATACGVNTGAVNAIAGATKPGSGPNWLDTAAAPTPTMTAGNRGVTDRRTRRPSTYPTMEPPTTSGSCPAFVNDRTTNGRTAPATRPSTMGAGTCRARRPDNPTRPRIATATPAITVAPASSGNARRLASDANRMIANTLPVRTSG